MKARLLLPTASDALAALALAVSVASAYFSYQQYRSSVDSQKTPIIIRVGAQQDKVTFFKYYEKSQDVLFKQRYRIILTNNSFNPESIIDWRLGERKDKGERWYPGLGPSLLDQDGNKLKGPFRISAKESKMVFLDIGQQVPRFAWDAVSKKIELNKELDWTQMNGIFSEAGFPYFGQLTPEGSVYTKNYTMDTWGNGPFYQEFNLRLLKADGQQITAELSLNVNDLFPQGEVLR